MQWSEVVSPFIQTQSWCCSTYNVCGGGYPATEPCNHDNNITRYMHAQLPRIALWKLMVDIQLLAHYLLARVCTYY